MKKIIRQSAPNIFYWSCQIKNHVLTRIGTLLKVIDMNFYIIKRKYGTITENIQIIHLVTRFWWRENIPNILSDHMIKALISIGLNGDLRITSIKTPSEITENSYFEHVSSVFLFSLRSYECILHDEEELYNVWISYYTNPLSKSSDYLFLTK